MSYLDHDGLAYFKSKLDRTFIADIEFDDGDIKLYGGDGTLLKTVVQEGTVTQKKSTANKEYPVLLCWDADAEEDQTMKTVWYGLDARVNPKFGYFYARRYYTEHPSYERTEAPTARAEWHHIFTDAVSAPMGEVYEYLDRIADGGEHRMELRLYGNPLSQYVDTPNHNEATDAVSLGLGATRGEKLTFFGYAPSTPIYLEDGTTMRKSLVRGDQYGKDIITRDWLNLNGSITGLVHTYMDETIDGYKTFLKTVTIDSGDDNNKAGLNVQGDVNIDSGDNTKPSNLHVQGNGDIDGNLNVDGTSDQHGNVHMYHDLDVDGNANTDGNQTVGGNLTVAGTTTTKILHVTDDATVDDNLNVGGTINKVSGNTTQEYVTYITNQSANRENIAANLIDGSKGLYLTSNGKIGVELQNQGGLKFDSNGGIYVDFASATDDVKDAVLSGLGMQIPLTSSKTFYVNKEHSAATTTWRNSQGVIDKTVGTTSKPFKTIQSAIDCATQGYSVGSSHIDIIITKSSDAGYNEYISLPQFQHTTGYIKLISANTSSASNYAVITNKATTIDNKAARPVSGLVSCNGSGWRIENIKFDSQVSNPGDGNAHFPSCISAGANAEVTVYGCTFNFAYSGAAPNGSTYMRMVTASTGGVVAFRLMEDSQTTISTTLGNSTGLTVFHCERQGQINFNSVNWGSSSSSYHNIPCSGSCTVFISASSSSIFSVIGGASYATKFTGNITGDACSIRALSTCTTIEEFPSSLSAGSKDSSCYVSSIIPTA